MGTKYKGFIIEKRYCVGSDFTVTEDGSIKPRRPRKEDIECYDIFDPMEGGSRWASEDTLPRCKEAINDLLFELNMKSNLPREWDKLL